MSVIEELKEIDAYITDKEKDIEYISKLKGTRNKVKYLRLKEYSQEEAAEMIGITTRHVQRIEKEMRDNNV